MIIRQGESQRISLSSGCIAGVQIFANLQHTTANTALAAADWLPSGTQVQVTLNRGGKDYVIMNNNLNLLGTYYSRRTNYLRFFTGFDMVLPAVGVDAVKIRSCFLQFRSPIKLQMNDKLLIEITFNSGFSANIDTGLSFLDAIAVPSTAHEFGIPQTNFQVVQTNASNDDFVNSSNVRHIEFLNLDQNDWANPVLQNIALSSDKLNYSATYREMLVSDSLKWPESRPVRFGTALPVAATPATVLQGLDFLPQCITLFEAGRGESLNNAVASLSFTSANVNASQNYVAFDTLTVDQRNLGNYANAVARDAKRAISSAAQSMRY